MKAATLLATTLTAMATVVHVSAASNRNTQLTRAADGTL
jgi:hypothetical protein